VIYLFPDPQYKDVDVLVMFIVGLIVVGIGFFTGFLPGHY